MRDDLLVFVVAFVLPLASLIGGFVLVAMALSRRGRLRELAYRERIAMIEKGLVPPPETDPERFERLFEAGAPMPEAHRLRARRSRNAGVLLIGLGLALMLLIGFAGGEAGVAVGVGGSIASVGLAFLIIGLWDLSQMSHRSPNWVPRDKPGADPSSGIRTEM